MTQVYSYLAMIYIWWGKHLMMKWKKWMLFKGNKTVHYFPKVTDDKNIYGTSKLHCLDIMIDGDLTWKHHIEYI